MLKTVLKVGLGISVVASTLVASPEKTKLKIGFIALTELCTISNSEREKVSLKQKV